MCESKTRKQYALQATDHVAYEMKMFLFCIMSIKQQDENLHNALVESFAIHLRSLYEFFSGDEKKYKDPKRIDETVYYSDIFDNSGKTVDSLSAEKNKANKGIAHIDRNRTLLKDTPWDYKKIYYVYKPLIRRFIDNSDISSNIKEKHLIDEINEYIKAIDTSIQKPCLKSVTDTTSGSVSVSTVLFNG